MNTCLLYTSFLPDILLDSEDVADGPILIFEPHVDNASAIGDPVKGRQHLYTASAALPFLTALLTSGGYIFPKPVSYTHLDVYKRQAHGTHFYFYDDMPLSAMAAGADMASVSMHKSGGSLTQSSFLLTGPRVNADYVRQVINLTQTTSGSYLLMSSLDISRRNLAIHGEEIFQKVRELARYARAEINAIGDYYAFCLSLIHICSGGK